MWAIIPGGTCVETVAGTVAGTVVGTVAGTVTGTVKGTVQGTATGTTIFSRGTDAGTTKLSNEKPAFFNENRSGGVVTLWDHYFCGPKCIFCGH